MASVIDRTWEAERLSSADFRRLSELVYQECGINLPPAKRTMLEMRIRKRLAHVNLPSCTEYAAYVLSPAGRREELTHFIDAVTTNKTDFFRESRHFEFLVDVAVPHLVRRYGAGIERPLRIWSAGCSTGEEPYTLAMTLADFAERTPRFRFEILATDICTRVLEHAQMGVYGPDAIAPVPEHFRTRYLLRSRDRENPRYRVVPELRSLIHFRRLNFMESNFGINLPMDVIFCRNVIIYFDAPTKDRLLRRFHAQLSPGGFLFLGHSESLNGFDLPLALAGPTVYRRPDGALSA